MMKAFHTTLLRSVMKAFHKVSDEGLPYYLANVSDEGLPYYLAKVSDEGLTSMCTDRGLHHVSKRFAPCYTGWRGECASAASHQELPWIDLTRMLQA
jgi:hypothetical protein